MNVQGRITKIGNGLNLVALAQRQSGVASILWSAFSSAEDSEIPMSQSCPNLVMFSARTRVRVEVEVRCAKKRRE